MDVSRRRPASRAHWLTGAALLALPAALGAGSTPSAAEAGTLSVLHVDLSRPLRHVTHCAAGAGWGISRTSPADDRLAALRPTSLRQPATLNGENAGYGALDVVARVSPHGLQHVQAVVSDLLPGYPPQWSSLDGWLGLVRAFADRKRQAGRDDVWYDLWNRPDVEAPAGWAEEGGYPAVWRASHAAVRAADPGAVIVGPSHAAWSREAYRDGLTWMRDSDCLPDVVSWHEMAGPSSIEAHVAEYRALLDELHIAERPVLINGYMTRDDVGAPGPCVAYLAALERARVGYACLASWHEPGTMGRLLAGESTLGGFWVYRWYAEMSGLMVSAGPATPGAGYDDTLASVDEAKALASIMVAGNRPRLIVYGLAATPFLLREGRVRVRIERVPHDGFAPVQASVLIAEEDVLVSDQSFELALPIEGWDAARITLSAPAPRRETSKRAPREQRARAGSRPPAASRLQAR